MFLPSSGLSQPACLLICVYFSDLPHSITASPIAWSVATKISLPIVPAVMALFHLGPERPRCYTPTQTIGHVSLLKTQSTVLRIVISQTLELLSLEVCVCQRTILCRGTVNNNQISKKQRTRDAILSVVKTLPELLKWDGNRKQGHCGIAGTFKSYLVRVSVPRWWLCCWYLEGKWATGSEGYSSGRAMTECVICDIRKLIKLTLTKIWIAIIREKKKKLTLISFLLVLLKWTF